MREESVLLVAPTRLDSTLPAHVVGERERFNAHDYYFLLFSVVRLEATQHGVNRAGDDGGWYQAITGPFGLHIVHH